MRYAYPRDREKHVIKSKVLPADAQNDSVDLIHLKKEVIR